MSPSLDHALVRTDAFHASAPSIGIERNIEWVPARLTPVGRARTHVLFCALLRATRTPEAVHEFNDPSIERARELVAECVEVRHGERLAGDPV